MRVRSTSKALARTTYLSGWWVPLGRRRSLVTQVAGITAGHSRRIEYSQQWVLLADVHYVFRKLTDQKVGTFEIGQEVMYAFDFNALDFVGAAHRRDILHT